MTKNLLALSSCAAVLLLSACGSGGPPPPTDPEGGGGAAAGPAAEVARCLTEERVRATVDKEGASLAEIPAAKDAVVARFRGNLANVFFFESQPVAAAAKGELENEELSNIEEEILIVFQRTPRPAQEEQIDDCLPDEEEQQQEEQGK